MAAEPADLARYHRQMLLPQIGEQGQRTLDDTHIAIIGCGALGCAAADALSRAGVRYLTLIDRDLVEWTNLPRQSLFTESDAACASPKVVAAAARIAQTSSSTIVNALADDLNARNAEHLIFGASDGRPGALPRPRVIIDGTDNFATRYLLNDISVKHGVPLVYGGVIATRGTVAALIPGHGPCLRCIAPRIPAPGTTPTCDTAGVFGPAVQIVGNAQAARAVAITLGAHDAGALLEFDVWSFTFRTMPLHELRDPSCTCCANKSFEFLDSASSDEPAALCGQNTIQVPPSGEGRINLSVLGAKLRASGDVQLTPYMLRLSLPAREGGYVLTVFPTGRALVRGTDRPEVARSLYARYIGA